MINTNIFKFDIIERAIIESNFTTKEEVVEFARKMRDVALENSEYPEEVKTAFKIAYKEINETLTLKELNEIKQVISDYN